MVPHFIQNIRQSLQDHLTRVAPMSHCGFCFFWEKTWAKLTDENFKAHGKVLGSLLLNQDVAHGFDVLVSVVWGKSGLITTRVYVVRISSCTKSDSGVTQDTIVQFIACDTNSCFGL